MTAVDTLTKLMDKARQITGLTEKITVPRLTGLMDHFDLHVNLNLIDGATDFSGNWTDSSGGFKWKMSDEKDPYNGNSVKVQNAGNTWYGIFKRINLQKGVYTFSLDYKVNVLDSNVSPRLQFYFSSILQGATVTNDGTDINITNVNQWNRASCTFEVTSPGNVDCRVELATPGCQLYVSSYKLEVGDLATPLQKVGGGS